MELPLRYTNPTRYDLAPYGALAKVVRDDGSQELFVQVTDEQEHSCWLTVGELLARTDCVDIMNIADAIEAYSAELELQNKIAAEKLLL